MKRSTLLLAAGCGLLLPHPLSAASLEELLRDSSVSYYSNFDSGSLTAQAGKGDWKSYSENGPLFVEVSAADRALDVDFQGYTRYDQTVLSSKDENWTLVFRARTGARPYSLLFAFGHEDVGGLAIRRGKTLGSLEVVLGKEPRAVISTPDTDLSDTSDDMPYRAYALTKCGAVLTLWTIDGSGETPTVLQVGDSYTCRPDEVVIHGKFQWGARHGIKNPAGEVLSLAGSISYIGVWKRVLSAEEMAAVDIPTPAPAAKDPSGFSRPGVLKDMFPAMPAKAVAYVAGANENFSLYATAITPETIVRRYDAEQTVGGRTMLVGSVSGTVGDGPLPNVSALKSMEVKTPGDRTVDLDVRLRLSGGSFGEVLGGSAQHAHYGHCKNTHWTLNGSSYVEIAPDATVNSLILAQKGSYNATTKGNFAAVIDGQIREYVLGGIWTRYQLTGTLEGDTHIVCRSVQTAEDVKLFGSDLPVGLVGGSAEATTDAGAVHKGNTAVTVDLPENASGEFKKSVIGGSRPYNMSDNWSISGSSTVSITAPTAVTFPKLICGGTYASANHNNAPINGCASVTLNGGTYTGTVIAGSAGAPLKQVKDADGNLTGGTATLTLKGNGNNLDGCTLLPMDNGAVAEGGSVLALESSTTDLSRTAAVGSFDILRLPKGRARLNLGERRLTSRFEFAPDSAVQLVFTPTADELRKGRAELGRFDGTEKELFSHCGLLPAGGQFQDWSPRLTGDGTVVFAQNAREISWQSAEARASWSEAMVGFRMYDNALLFAGVPTEAVTDSDVTAGTVTVGSDFTLTGTGRLIADSITVSDGGRWAAPPLPPNANCRFVRLTILSRPTKRPTTDTVHSTLADGLALAEIILTQNGRPVAWPEGTAVTATQANTAGKAKAANLIDGKYEGDGKTDSKWFWQLSSTNADSTPVSNCSITIDAGPGNIFVFDGCRLAPADVKGRNPQDWRLDISADGTHWCTVCEMKQTPEEAWELSADTIHPLNPAAVRTANDSAGLLTVQSGATLAGTHTAQSVVFEPGARLEVSPDAVPVLNGALSGTVTPVPPAGQTFSAHCFCLVRCAESAELTWNLPAPYTYVFYKNGAYWASDLALPFRVAGGQLTDDNGRTDLSPEELLAVPENERTVVIEAADNVRIDAWPNDWSVARLDLRGAAQDSPNPPKLTLADGIRETMQIQTITLTGCLRADELPAGKLTFEKGAVLVTDTAKGKTVCPPRLFGPGTWRKTGPGTVFFYGKAKDNTKSDGSDAIFGGGLRIELREGLLSWKNSGGRTVLNTATVVFFDEDHDGKADGNVSAPGVWPDMRGIPDPVFAFEVPEGVTDAEAFDSNATDDFCRGSVVKRGKGDLRLLLAWFNSNDAPHTGDTVIEDGRIVALVGKPRVDWESKITGPGDIVFRNGTDSSPTLNLTNAAQDFGGSVSIGENVTVTLKDSAVMNIRSGKTLTCPGTLKGRAAFDRNAVLSVAGGHTPLNAPTFGDVLNIVATQEQVDAGLVLAKETVTGPAIAYVRNPEGTMLGATVGVSEDGTLSLIPGGVPADPDPTEPEVVLPEEIQQAPEAVKTVLTELAREAGITKVTEIRAAADSVGKQAIEALGVFSGVAKAVKTEGTDGIIEVSYSFGVTEMKHAVIDGTPVLLTAAAVTSGTGTADCLPGTVLGAAEVGTETRSIPAIASQQELSDAEITGFFGAKAPGTRYLKLILNPGAPAALFRVSVSRGK